MKRLVLALMVGGLPLANSDEGKELLDKTFNGVNSDCQLYSSILSEAMWRKAYRKAAIAGNAIDYSLREKIYSDQYMECVTVHHLLIMDTVKKGSPPMAWIKSGGEKTVQRLEATLDTLIP